MEGVDVSAKTVDEAVEKALAELGLDRSQVDVEVIREGRGGILGIGGEEARVVVRPKEGASLEGEEVKCALEVLETLLSYLKIDASVRVRAPETPGDGVGLVRTVLDISGDDLGILIGRRGDTLASLQYLVNLIVGRKLKAKTGFGVDVEGYRRRREQSLKSLAHPHGGTGEKHRADDDFGADAAERAADRASGARARRAVITESIGEGENRKVVICPAVAASPV